MIEPTYGLPMLNKNIMKHGWLKIPSKQNYRVAKLRLAYLMESPLSARSNVKVGGDE